MAIAILNELTYTEDSIDGKLLSAHANPSIYISESDLTSTYMEVDVNNVTFTGVLIDSDATYNYFYLDLTEIVKYFSEIGSQEFNDELSFMTSSGFERTNMAANWSEEIRTYNSSGTLISTYNTENYFAHLGAKFPSPSGFNLWDIVTLKNLLNLKWSNNTYNALFLYKSSGNITIHNRTTGQSFTLSSSDGITQHKFAKKIKEVYSKKRSYQFDDVDLLVADLNESYHLPFDGVDRIDGATLKYKALAFEDNDTTIGSLLRAGGEMSVVSVPNDGRLKQYKSKVIETTDWAGVSFSSGAGTNTHAIIKDVRVEIEYNDLFDSTILAEGVNVLEIITNDGTSDFAATTIEIDYTLDECLTPLLWQHPQLGYVSFPFDGFQIEGEKNSKLTSISDFIISMAGRSGLVNNSGYDSSPRITLSTNCNKKYLPLLKEIYSSRHTYIWTGENGDDDEVENWTKVIVSGAYTINEKKNNVQFNIELTLPTKQNVKF